MKDSERVFDREWIRRHVPHQGRMCLLDEIVSWDEERICCRTASHRDADNPLRAHGRLGIASGIEYAAQAMALHGALGAMADAPAHGAVAGAPAHSAAAGFLASVRAVRITVGRLDDVPGELSCAAVRMAGDRGTAMYEFEIRSGHAVLIAGRTTVVLDAGGQLPS